MRLVPSKLSRWKRGISHPASLAKPVVTMLLLHFSNILRDNTVTKIIFSTHETTLVYHVATQTHILVSAGHECRGGPLLR